jgi:hypothetical protein
MRAPGPRFGARAARNPQTAAEFFPGAPRPASGRAGPSAIIGENRAARYVGSAADEIVGVWKKSRPGSQIRRTGRT